MNYIKKITKCFVISFTTFIFLLLFFTLLFYLNIIPSKGIVIVNFIIPIFSIFIGAFFLKNKSGCVDGIIYGLSIFILLLLINLIIYKSFFIKSLIYYSILIISSILGSSLNLKRHRK